MQHTLEEIWYFVIFTLVLRQPIMGVLSEKGEKQKRVVKEKSLNWTFCLFNMLHASLCHFGSLPTLRCAFLFATTWFGCSWRSLVYFFVEAFISSTFLFERGVVLCISTCCLYAASSVWWWVQIKGLFHLPLQNRMWSLTQGVQLSNETNHQANTKWALHLWKIWFHREYGILMDMYLDISSVC